MSCEKCGKETVYSCSVCGDLLCYEHTRLRAVCLSCATKPALKCTTAQVVVEEERKRIREFVERFFGEEEQIAFDKEFKVAELPAYVARVGTCIVGFISFAEEGDNLIIVALGVLPKYQNSDVGRSLIREVESEAERKGKKKVSVATSNDDLPALALYQSLGFQIYDVAPNVIAEKHGETLLGTCGLPVRDELRLRKIFDSK